MNIIAVDLGGTNTRVARFTDINDVTMVVEPVKRRNSHVYEEDLQFIIDTAKKLSGNQPVNALGIGVPGRVNDEKTRMLASNNLPEWVDHDFCTDLSQALDCHVFLDNDCVAAALGEAYYGDVSGDFHYLIWGTGISNVEVKHSNDDVTVTYIRPNYRDFFEAWEKDCSGSAILRNYNKPGEKLTSEEWAKINTLFERYLKEYISTAKPPAIVFGGGLAVHHVEIIIAHSTKLGIPIKVTQFGNNSGLIGSLGLVQRGIKLAIKE